MTRLLPTSPPLHDRNQASGSTAVEFAILAPVYLLLMPGLNAYGIYLGAAHSVQRLSAEGGTRRARHSARRPAERHRLSRPEGRAPPPALDAGLNELPKLLGLSLGQADVRVHGATCGRAVLVR